MPPRQVMATLATLPAASFYERLALNGGAVKADFHRLQIVADRYALAVHVQARRNVHGRRFSRNLDARMYCSRLRRQNVRAVNAARTRAEHQIVARRAPARLLQHFNIGQTVLRAALIYR